MTGPPYVSGKTSPARGGHPVPDSTTTAVYQLSLSSILPWLESGPDRTLKTSNTPTSHISINNSKIGDTSFKSESVNGTFISATGSYSHDSRQNTIGANSSSTNSSWGSNNNSNAGTRSRVYNIQLPTVYSGRSVRPYGSFSSGSGDSGTGTLGGSLAVASSGNVSTLGVPIPLPPQGSLNLSSLGTQTVTQGPHKLSLLVRG